MEPGREWETVRLADMREQHQEDRNGAQPVQARHATPA
jgi:hypothetical protein